MVYKKRYVTRPPASYKKNNRGYKKTKTKRKKIYPLIGPANMISRFRYIGIDKTAFTNSGLPYTYITFNLNGLYDVYPGAASTDVPGFPAWGTIYSNYRALEATITVTYSNPDVGAVYFGLVCQTPDTVWTPVSWAAWRETYGNKYCKQVFLGPHGSSNDTTTIRQKVDFGRMLGDRRLYNSNLNYRGEILATNPNNIFPLYVYCLQADTATPFASTNPVSVNIEWNVLLSNRELQI